MVPSSDVDKGHDCVLPILRRQRVSLLYLTFVSLGISKRYLKYHGTRCYGEGLAKLITAANLQLVVVFCCFLFVCFIIYFLEGEGANVVICVTMSTTKESESKTFRQDADCSFLL